MEAFDRWIGRLFAGLIILLLIACLVPIVFIGVTSPIWLAYTELRDHHVGLGLGICVAAILAIIKGILGALSTSTTGPPRPPSDD